MRLDSVFGSEVSQALVQATVSGGETGDTVDLGADAGKFAGKVVFLAGTLTTTVVCSLEESVDDSVWTAVSAEDVVGGVATVSIDAADDNTAAQIGYIGRQRYFRLAVDSGAGGLSAIAQVDSKIV